VKLLFLKKGEGEVMVEFAQPLSAVWAHQKGMRPQVGLFLRQRFIIRNAFQRKYERTGSVLYLLNQNLGGWVPGMRMGISSGEKDSVRVKVLTGCLEVPAG